MLPAYHEGSLIIVSPAASIRRGDRVVVKTRGGEVIVSDLRRRTAKTVELRAINPPHSDRTLPVRDVLWMARVVWASQ
jgi:phage repressor protein C with HTH and peptisase S24 domain